MSLYHYVDSKADLLDAMLEVLFSEIQLPRDVPEHEWETSLRRGMGAFRQVLVSYRGAWELFASRPATGEHALAVLSWSASRFMKVGLDEKQASMALHAAVGFVQGHVASEVGLMSISRSSDGRADLEATGSATAEFMKPTRQISPEEMFQSGLDVVVAGLRVHYDLP
jgi:AcrR family transcriptional regulator